MAIMNVVKAVLLAAMFLTIVTLASITESRAADLGYDERDRNAEIILRGMEIIAGAIASRLHEPHYHYYGPPTYYYDQYAPYYYDGYGYRHHRHGRYYRRHHRH